MAGSIRGKTSVGALAEISEKKRQAAREAGRNGFESRAVVIYL